MLPNQIPPMRGLKVTVRHLGNTFVFEGRRAVELKLWSEGKGSPLVMCKDSSGFASFMYHSMGVTPNDVRLEIEELFPIVN